MQTFDIDEDVFENQTPEVQRAMLASFQKQLDARRAADGKRKKKSRIVQKEKAVMSSDPDTVAKDAGKPLDIPSASNSDDFNTVYHDDLPRESVSSSALLHGYTKTPEEVEEDRRFEEQKRALEERAERLRRLSFDVKGEDTGTDEIANVPAYMRKNMPLEKHGHSSSGADYSDYSIGVNPEQGEQGHIQTLNTFLDGKKPD